MANLIQFYSDGTFEGIESSWTYNNFTFIGVPYQRSNTFAFEGTYSGRFTTIASGPSGFNYLCNARVPVSSLNENYEVTIMMRCSGGIPDGVDFVMIGSPQEGNEPFLIKANAVAAKAGWVELKINFTPMVISDPNLTPNTCFNVSVWVVGNWTNFIAAYSESDAYLQFGQWAGTNSEEIPAGEFVYLDAWTSDIAAPIVVPDEQLIGRKLYHVRNFFWLSDGEQIYEIDEPIGWDKILLNMSFDLTTFRFKFEFTDKDVTLQFDRSCGFSILLNLWNTKGPDAFASLKFGEIDEANVATVHFEMQMNFAEAYDETKYVIKMNCERRSMQDTFRTRFDFETDIMDNATMDERSLTPLTSVKVWLHPTRVDLASEYIANPQSTSPALGNIPFTGHYISVPPLQAKIQSIEGASDPLAPDGSFYYSGSTFKNGISYKRLVVTARVRWKVTNLPNVGPAKMYLRIFKLSGISQPGFDPTSNPLPENDFMDFYPLPQFGGVTTRTFTINSAGFVMKPDEALFIRIGTQLTDIDNDTPGDSAWVNPELWFMNIEYSETAAPTLVEAFQIHEVLERQLELITNVHKPLKTNFFGRTDIGYDADGCGSHNVLNNGLMMREIQKEFILSTKSWFNSLRAIFCLGMAIERNDQGEEWIRVEPLEYFFRDVEMLRLTITSDFQREGASDFMFNALEFGYSKYPNNNQTNSLGDHMTVKQYITPWKSLVNKCSQISDFILSSLYIQLTRSQNIRNNPTGNFETDKNTFMIDVQDKVTFVLYPDTQIQFFAETRTIRIEKWDVPIGQNDDIIIGSTVLNNGVRTVTNVLVSIELNYTILTVQEIVFNETVNTVDINFFSERFIPSRDEQFAEVNGLTQVGSGFPYYNLRHHVKRMMLRWSKFYTTGFRDGFYDRFISGNNNNSVKTTLKEDADCIGMDGRSGAFSVGDTDKDVVNELYAIQTLSKPLFGKNRINFSAPLSWIAFNKLRKGFEGRHPEGKDYGYITAFDNDNKPVKVYILQTKFNPITQICKFETIEKAN